MTGLEVVAGWVAGWVWRRARHAAGRVEARVDDAVDARLERMYDLVIKKLSDDPALGRLESEAAVDLDTAPEVSDRTRQRVTLALEDAVDSDPSFATQLQSLIDGLAGAGGGVAAASGHGFAAGQDVRIQADGGSVAAGTVDGSVTLGNPPLPGTGLR